MYAYHSTNYHLTTVCMYWPSYNSMLVRASYRCIIAHVYTVKHAHAITSIKQSPVL